MLYYYTLLPCGRFAQFRLDLGLLSTTIFVWAELQPTFNVDGYGQRILFVRFYGLRGFVMCYGRRGSNLCTIRGQA